MVRFDFITFCFCPFVNQQLFILYCWLLLLPPNRYSKLMGDEPDLDPDINKDFFENNVLQLDPSLLTENGMKCFERFFKAVNCREGKLVAKRRAYMMDDLELIGLDYLWRVRGFVAYIQHCFGGRQIFVMMLFFFFLLFPICNNFR